jgi:undecaprenyl-diphosphatase
MGLDPTRPEMTLLLVMLHTGTMFAVIFFFGNSWKKTFFISGRVFRESLKLVMAATFLTGIVGLLLKFLIERSVLGDVPHAQIELLFGNLGLISAALAVVGVFIIFSEWKVRRLAREENTLDMKGSCWIGAVQGVCLPFRGFSRSGATISTGLLFGVAKARVEEFSFALAVVLTPPVIVREIWRLLKAHHASLSDGAAITGLFYPSLMGMALSFVSGILALRWLSSWLERGRWHLFGIYCLCFSGIVFLLYRAGF